LKKSFVVSLLACGLVSLSQAQTPANPPAPATVPTKVAIINIQAAILSTADGKKAAEDLRTKFDARKTALERRSTDLRNKVETLRKGAATMSEDARNKLMRDNDAENKAITRDGEDLNNDMDQENGRLMNEIGGKMLEIISQYASANAYAMVLNVGDQGALLWHNPSTDITADIIKLYDQAHPAGAPASKPAAPAPPPTKK
jgi:outer membrane protein